MVNGGSAAAARAAARITAKLNATRIEASIAPASGALVSRQGPC
jgi:hypothetical protein